MTIVTGLQGSGAALRKTLPSVNWRGCLLLGLLLAGPVLAQEVRLTVYTEPPGACISRPEGQILGFSGEPFPLPRAEPLTLRLLLDGYQEERLELSADQVRAGHFPEVGPLQLRPLPSRRPGWLPGLGLAGLAALGALAWARRQRALPEPAELPAPAPDPSELPAELDPRRGMLLGGRYQLLERIGIGGWGTVYRATDQKAPEPLVAVKVAHRWVVERPQGRSRLHREVNHWRDIEHPGLVRMLASDPDAPEPYVVMELVEGVPLRERIDPQGLDLEAAWGYLEPLLFAVEALHELRLVHRDLKPENIMITPAGQLKVMDFGLLKQDLADGLHAAMAWQGDISWQESCPILGTPPYLAPEQCSGVAVRRAGLACDQYALGMIAYELLTGRVPYTGTVGEVQEARLVHPPAPPRRWREMPPAFEAVILRLLELEPESRYPSLREARLAFEAALREPGGAGSSAAGSPS